MKDQTILIVDDEMVFVESLKNHFMEQDKFYEIKTAFNGAEALDIIAKDDIDLMILDLNMPVLDGIEVLVELNNLNTWLPVIIMTSVIIMTPEENKDIFEEFGIVDYMEKPVNLEKLNQRVEEALNRAHDPAKPATFAGLSGILRLIEHEKRTGVLTITFETKTGKIFFRDGDVVDADCAGLEGEQALIPCLTTACEDKQISVEYVHHERKRKITRSLSEILSELT